MEGCDEAMGTIGPNGRPWCPEAGLLVLCPCWDSTSPVASFCRDQAGRKARRRVRRSRPASWALRSVPGAIAGTRASDTRRLARPDGDLDGRQPRTGTGGGGGGLGDDLAQDLDDAAGGSRSRTRFGVLAVVANAPSRAGLSRELIAPSSLDLKGKLGLTRLPPPRRAVMRSWMRQRQKPLERQKGCAPTSVKAISLGDLRCRPSSAILSCTQMA